MCSHSKPKRERFVWINKIRNGIAYLEIDNEHYPSIQIQLAHVRLSFFLGIYYITLSLFRGALYHCVTVPSNIVSLYHCFKEHCITVSLFHWTLFHCIIVSRNIVSLYQFVCHVWYPELSKTFPIYMHFWARPQGIYLFHNSHVLYLEPLRN